MRRFGELPGSLLYQVTEASRPENIVRWFERAVDAATLDDVFAAPPPAAKLDDMFAARPGLSPDGADQPTPARQAAARVSQAWLDLQELMGQGAYEDAFQDGMRGMLMYQLVHRFGALPESVTSRLKDARIPRLKRWAERIAEGASLADVFATL